MAELPLPTLLSQVLVAFTIEFDNEFEHRMPHQTTVAAKGADARHGPWLVSRVMWANVMQYVDDDGIRVGELHDRARTAQDSLAGLQRWGYVVVAPDPGDDRSRPPSSDLVVRPTKWGRRAQDVWRPLARVVIDRWRARFGAADVEVLTASLRAIVGGLDVALPAALPIVHPAMGGGRAEILQPARRGEGRHLAALAGLDLPTLLAQTLLAFTLDFEGVSKLSLPVSANTLRVLDDQGVRVRDLPRATGVSKEANAMATGFLERRECVVAAPDPTPSRGKVVRLTAKGRGAQAKYRRVLRATEDAWIARFGAAGVASLRTALEPLVGDPATPGESPLFAGLEPYPDGWRARVAKPATLPHYPMILHRGGYPDGS